MDIIPRTDLAPYAEAPLRHLAESLHRHLAHIEGSLHLTWNTLRPDIPQSREHFFSSAENVHTLCMETPLFGREFFAFDGSADPTRAHYRLALHDPSTICGGFDRRYDPGRRDRMFSTLGIELAPWREPSPDHHIIYALQVPDDTSLKGLNMFRAALWDLYELKRITSRKIILAVHPDCYREDWAKSRLASYAEDFRHLLAAAEAVGAHVTTAGESTHDYFPGAHCVIAYTSGITTEAILAGIPCVTLHRGNFQHAVCANALLRVEGDMFMSSLRDSHLATLARIQWSWQEIADGSHIDTVLHLLAQ